MMDEISSSGGVPPEVAARYKEAYMTDTNQQIRDQEGLLDISDMIQEKIREDFQESFEDSAEIKKLKDIAAAHREQIEKNIEKAKKGISEYEKWLERLKRIAIGAGIGLAIGVVLGGALGGPIGIGIAGATYALVGGIFGGIFEDGGPVFGPSHSQGGVVAELEGGEHVWSRRDVAAAGGHGVVERLRKGGVNGEYTIGTLRRHQNMTRQANYLGLTG